MPKTALARLLHPSDSTQVNRKHGKGKSEGTSAYVEPFLQGNDKEASSISLEGVSNVLEDSSASRKSFKIATK